MNGRTNIKSKKKVLIALSGGIDSAVSAYLLLKQGYEVEAAFMKNWTSQEGLKYDECPWITDRQDALRVAAFLGIPMHTLDFEKEYAKNVLNYFYKEYKAGRTPNPDVMCNKEIKFKMLYNWAMKRGFDYMATGHYAQIGTGAGARGEVRGQRETQKSKHSNLAPLTSNLLTPLTYSLLRSEDEFKDQTYFIYNIKTEQLPHVLFPVGGMKKTAVRTLAKKLKLPNADKKESMGLCFVGKIRLKDFLEQKLKPKPGPIVLTSPNPSLLRRGTESTPSLNKVRGTESIPPLYKGRLGGVVIGEHQGLYYYTIGQRQGIRVGAKGPYYVIRKDLKKNALHVTNDPADPALESREIEIHSVNWIGGTVVSGQWSVSSGKKVPARQSSKESNHLPLTTNNLAGRFRHQGELIPLTIKPIRKDHYLVKFSKPQKAVASGQSLVLYDGKVCVGGGVIV